VGADDGGIETYQSCTVTSLSKNERRRLVSSLERSLVLSRAETRTLRRGDERRLHAFEMWVRRRMKKVRWTERKAK
jgi:hypothetical protein